jgi:hypothetical protein
MLPRQPIFAPTRRTDACDPCDACCSCLRCRPQPRRTVLVLWLVAAAVYLLIVLLPSPAATPAVAVPFFADDDGEADDQAPLRERARPRRAREGAVHHPRTPALCTARERERAACRRPTWADVGRYESYEGHWSVVLGTSNRLPTAA